MLNIARMVRIENHADVPASHVERTKDGVEADYSSVAGNAELEVALATTSHQAADPGNRP